MHTFLNFSYCKGSAVLFFHLLLKCLFSENVLQMSLCKWGLCSSYRKSFSFSSVHIFTLHQTFVFLLRAHQPFLGHQSERWSAPTCKSGACGYQMT